MDTNYIIETKNLTKQYGSQKSVADLNIHVKRGRIYGLLGRNGAGKTTTMKMLLDLTKPMPKARLLQLPANLDVSDVRSVRRPVRTVRSLLQTSVHTSITINVQTAVHVKKHAREKSFSKTSYHMNKIPAVRGNASLTGIFSNRCLLFAFCYVMIEKQKKI